MKATTSRVGLVLIFAVLLQGVWPAAASERMAVKVNTANIRSGPSTGADLLWRVEKYYPILVVEKKGAWRRFKDFEGDEGWIHSTLVDSTETVIVKVKRCNVRTGPGTDHAIAFTVGQGIPFKVLKKKGRWRRVQHADGDIGWIFNRLVW